MNGQALMLDQVLIQRHQDNKEVVNVDEPAVKLVVFTLNGEWFAFPGANIREILSHVEIFFVPGCPPSLEGVINVRGDIESVMRLHEMLAFAPPAEELDFVILLGQGGNLKSGIRVDQVVDVIDVANSKILPPPSTLPEHLRNIVSGILQFQERPVTVLDLDRIFNDYCAGLG